MTPSATLTRTLALVLAASACFAADEPLNLIPNGGFEDGVKAWSWGQWRGLPEPGFLDKETPYKGQACYTMGLAGTEGERMLYSSVEGIDPTKDYELSIALRGKGLAENSVSINLLQWGTEKSEKIKPQGWVWVPARRGHMDLITTGGTFDWKEFRVHIYRQGIKASTKRVTLYIRRASISKGELGVDEACLIQVEPVEYREPAQPKTRPGRPANKKAARTRPAPPKPRAKTPTVLLLDRCETTDRWSIYLGWEFPGAKGELDTQESDGRTALKVNFDLSGGRYVGALRANVIRQADALLFAVRSFEPRNFIARVLDATGQVHAAGFRTRTGEWEHVELPLTQEQFRSHWGGGNDGKIHFPIQSILVACISAKRGKGSFLLRDVAIRTTEPKKTWQIDVRTDAPGHIHFTQDPKIKTSATITNRVRETRKAAVTLEIVGLDRREIASKTETVLFEPWSTQTVRLSLDSPGPGYFHVSAEIGDGTANERSDGAFGVAHRPVRYGQRDADSFFAMHVSDPLAAARIGVHWSRCFNFWKYSESSRGRYGHRGDYVKACLEAGIDVMMCLDYREPSWLKPKTDAQGLPTAEALERYANFVRDAVRNHPNVPVFEIQNEPNLELCSSRNLPLDKGVEFYVRIVNTIAPIIRQEAPQALICGCTVSGGDYMGFQFSRPVLERVGSALDIYGGHPYASPRIFGPGLRPAFPEDNVEAEKHRAAVKLLHEFDRPRKMWIGEKGWEIKNSAPLLGGVSLSFADCLARSLIIAKSVPGIGKYFWFLQQQEFSGSDGKYAIFRGHPVLQPMPGALAYANVAYRLDHAQPVESILLAGGTVQAHVFTRPQARAAVAALWSVRKPFVMRANLPPEAQAFDLYGRAVQVQNIELSGAPVFILTPGACLDALRASIKSADLIPGEPFEVILAALDDINTLRLGLLNLTGKSLPVQSRMDGQGERIILPSVADPTWLRLKLNRPVTQRGGEPIQLTLSAGDAEPRKVTLSADLLPVTRMKGMAVDGQTNDWEGVPEIVVNTPDRIQPPDPAGWRGPEDLSARASLAWDQENLYMLVRVTDDKHVTPNLQAFWNSDSLQVALDVMNDAYQTPGFDDDDREYGVVVDAHRVHTYQAHPRGAKPTFRAEGKRTGTQTLYEMAFPWADLGRDPKAGMVFSLNFIANENDGAGRKYWMGITPGIGEGKRPGQYRDFYLAE